MAEDIKSDTNKQCNTVTNIQTPRPSSPRKFFARLYGHLEEPKTKQTETKTHFDSESSSDIEVEESGLEENEQRSSSTELIAARSPPIWPPPPLPLCPRPMLFPHQQLAFGAGLAAFRK